MKIWIDISNAPHVRFFKLMDMYDIDFVSVGKHGVTLEEKLKESAERVVNLADLISGENFDVALSKHSIELPRVAFGLGIPSLFVLDNDVLDNEHAMAANKLTLPLCSKIIVPSIIDEWKLLQYGANPNDIIKYNGTSELMHFNNFVFNENIFEDLGLDLPLQKTILMRPEPSLASYLNTDCRKSVLSPVVDVLKEYANILILPRFKEQAEIFEGIKNVTILKPPVDTSSIIKACDLVIGAGGTMNREAAILQTPVISCYPGDTLSVDQFYVDNGLMYRTTDLEDITKQALSFIVNPHKPIDFKTDDLFGLIVNKTYELGNSKK